MRWLHISDLHFGKRGLTTSEEDTWKSLLVHVRRRTQEGLGPDYIFVTGDITWDGSLPLFTYGENAIGQLLDASGFQGTEGWRRVFVAPGNHDVCHTKKNADGEPAESAIPGLFAAEEKELSQVRQSASKTLRVEQRINCEPLENFRSFANALKSKGDSHFNEVPDNSLTFYGWGDGGGFSFGIISINTEWASYSSRAEDGGRHPCLPCGSELVKRAIEEVAPKLNKKRLVIILGHHPIEYLYDFPEIKMLADEKGLALLYLSGHLHRTRSEKREDASGASFEIGAGAVHLDIYQPEKYPHRILWGKFDEDEIDIEPLYQHPMHRNYWVLDTSAFPSRDYEGYHLKLDVAPRFMIRPRPFRVNPKVS